MNITIHKIKKSKQYKIYQKKIQRKKEIEQLLKGIEKDSN